MANVRAIKRTARKKSAITLEKQRPTVILITGTPGTGKTTLAKALSKNKAISSIISIKEFVRTKKLSEGKDQKMDSLIVDPTKLSRKLIKEIEQSRPQNADEIIIIEGHMSHFLAAKYADLCVVLMCDLKKLRNRLAKRGYSDSKLKQNLEAEIFEICLTEAIELGHRTLILKDSDSTAAMKRKIFAALGDKMRVLKR